MKRLLLSLAVVLLSQTCLQADSFDVGGSGLKDSDIGQFSSGFQSPSDAGEQDVFRLEGEGATSCPKLTITPEPRADQPGYLFNLYLKRNGHMKVIGSYYSSHNFRIGSTKKVYKKNIKPLVLKGKDEIKIGDVLIIDGWKTPSRKQGKVNIFGDSEKRIQRCLYVRAFPKNCKLYLNENGLTYTSAGQLDDTFDFEGGISGCSAPELQSLQTFLHKK